MRLEYEVAVTGERDLKRILRSIDNETERNAKRGATRDRARTRSSVQAAKKTEAAAIKAAKDAAASTARAEKTAQAASIKAARKVQLEKERAAKAAANESIRQMRRVAAEEARKAKWRQGIQNRHFQQVARDQMRHERTVARQQEATSKKVRRGFGSVTKGTVSFLGRGLSSTAAVAGLGVGALSANAVSTQMDEAKQASILANAAQAPEEKNKILKEAQSVKGFTGSEALSGMGEFVAKTGDLQAARDMLQEMGRIALATGTDLGDLGATAGQGFNVLADQIEDPVERIKQLKSLLGTLVVQGQMGAVEISDLARDFGKLGAATRAFEGTAPDMLRTMGAFAQIAVAKGGAVNSKDASTASLRLSADMVTNRKKFAKVLGSEDALRSETDSSKLRNPLEIMLDVLDKTGGDVMKTGGLFGQESVKVFKGLAATYTAAESKEKGSGRAAVEKDFNRLAGARMDEASLEKMFTSRTSDADVRVTEAMKEFNKAMGEDLLPMVTNQLIPALVDLAPVLITTLNAFSELASLISADPINAALVAIAGLMVAEAGKAFLTARLAGGAAAAAGGAGSAAVAAGGGGIIAALGGKAAAGLGGAGAAVAGAGTAAVAGLGALALGSVAGAGYMGNELHKSVQVENGEGGFFENLSAIINNGADQRREADKTMRELAEHNKRAAEKLSRAADKLERADLSQRNEPLAIR